MTPRVPVLQLLHGSLLPLLLFLHLPHFLPLAHGRVYKKCELARELKYVHGLPDHQIPTWVCIAKHESAYDTAAVNRGSGDHGLFQISDIYWCSPPGSGYACNLPCSAFEDDDISDDITCIRRIFNEHKQISGDGFNAWVVYPLYCKGDVSSYTAGCYDGLDNTIGGEEPDYGSPGYPSFNASAEQPPEEEEYEEIYEFPPLPTPPKVKEIPEVNSFEEPSLGSKPSFPVFPQFTYPTPQEETTTKKALTYQDSDSYRYKDTTSKNSIGYEDSYQYHDKETTTKSYTDSQDSYQHYYDENNMKTSLDYKDSYPYSGKDTTTAKYQSAYNLNGYSDEVKTEKQQFHESFSPSSDGTTTRKYTNDFTYQNYYDETNSVKSPNEYSNVYVNEVTTQIYRNELPTSKKHQTTTQNSQTQELQSPFYQDTTTRKPYTIFKPHKYFKSTIETTTMQDAIRTYTSKDTVIPSSPFDVYTTKKYNDYQTKEPNLISPTTSKPFTVSTTTKYTEKTKKPFVFTTFKPFTTLKIASTNKSFESTTGRDSSTTTTIKYYTTTKKHFVPFTFKPFTTKNHRKPITFKPFTTRRPFTTRKPFTTRRPFTTRKPLTKFTTSAFRTPSVPSASSAEAPATEELSSSVTHSTTESTKKYPKPYTFKPFTPFAKKHDRPLQVTNGSTTAFKHQNSISIPSTSSVKQQPSTSTMSSTLSTQKYVKPFTFKPFTPFTKKYDHELSKLTTNNPSNVSSISSVTEELSSPTVSSTSSTRKPFTFKPFTPFTKKHDQQLQVTESTKPVLASSTTVLPLTHTDISKDTFSTKRKTSTTPSTSYTTHISSRKPFSTLFPTRKFTSRRSTSEPSSTISEEISSKEKTSPDSTSTRKPFSRQLHNSINSKDGPHQVYYNKADELQYNFFTKTYGFKLVGQF